MVSTTIAVLIALLNGVCGESPTAPPDQWYVESSVSEDANPVESSMSEERSGALDWTTTDRLDALHYELSKQLGDDAVWTDYSPEIYPLFRKAVKELAASEHGILIFWDTLNRPELSREFFDKIFTAHNRLVSEDVSSTTEEPHVSEDLEDSQYTVEEANSSEDSSSEYNTSSEDSVTEYHTSVSDDEDEANLYYTTESPMVEAILTNEAVYESTMSPETQEDSSEEPGNLYMTSTGEVYEATTVVEDEESSEDPSVAVSASDWENVVRRSGDMAEERVEATEDNHCEGCPLQVGSIRGIPGVHFPNYDDIPITSFSCADKQIPGFYADLETGCQVFHVCWPHRRESFLCPIGTLFNQAILACDYWYSTNCSLSSLFFDVSTLSPKPASPEYEKSTESYQTSSTEDYEMPHEEYERPVEIPDELPHEEYERPVEIPDERPHVDLDWFRVSKFVPIKSKVTVYTKHSSKKPGLKYVVKQKHDVLPIVENFLELTRNVAKNAVRLIPEVHVIKQGIPKSKLVKVAPAAKLRPCLKVKDLKIEHRRPIPPIVKKPQPLDPRFVVKPVVVQRPVIHIKKIVHKVPLKAVKPLGKVAVKSSKLHAPETVVKALDVAGHVLQRGILDLTRQAMVESHVKSLKYKH